MPYRTSLIFAVTTEPTQRFDASPHSGGWTEGHWTDDAPVADGGGINDLALKRSRLLPKQVDIIGWRIAKYDISGNRLTPDGTQAVKHRYPGNAAFGSIDAPQVGLLMGATFNGAVNTTRFTLRGMPDGQIDSGEYQPTPAFRDAVAALVKSLTSGSNPWGSIVRDRGQAPQRVERISGGVMQLANPGVYDVGDYIRLLNVTDVNGNNIPGTYRISVHAPGGFAYTLEDFPTGVEVRQSGTVRLDNAVFKSYASINPGRCVVKKIGAPFEKYRGRHSKRR